ncbi:MAG: DUF2237 domain-containing protein [Polyangiales bacterium]
MSETTTHKNVLGGALEDCSHAPRTGYFRDGCCRTDDDDHGRHVVCARVTAEFLAFSRSVGNDLSTPRPEYQFAGLKPGDCWCLCAMRWREAFEAGMAPPVRLTATHEAALRYVSLDDLTRHALDVD